MRIIFLLFLIFFSMRLTAQQKRTIQFIPIFNGAPLKLDTEYYTAKDTILIETLKFYLSEIQFCKDNVVLDRLEKKYHLLDLMHPTSLILKHKSKNDFSSIRFKIGVDSTTNVSGAFGEDLDPTNGMYWTWQSGFINFKLEGRSRQSPARQHRFQLHIGGYKAPFNTLQEVELKTSKKKIILSIDIENLLTDVGLTERYEVMSPSENAVSIARYIAHNIKLKQR